MKRFSKYSEAAVEERAFIYVAFNCIRIFNITVEHMPQWIGIVPVKMILIGNTFFFQFVY